MVRRGVRLAWGQRDGREADALSVPGVSRVEVAVFILNDGRIGVLAGLVFEGGEDLEVLSVGADGEVERGAVFGAVVEDEHGATVAKTDGVDAGVGVGKVDGVGLGPCDAVVEGVGHADACDVGGGTGIEAEMLLTQRYDGGLNDSVDVFLCVA